MTRRINKTCFKKGCIPWNKGKTLSEKTKEKIRLANLGKKASEETKRKMSVKRKGKNNVNYGKFGKAHPCYRKNKKHPFLKLIRETYKYRQWRSDVFTRDDFTCIFCGERGVELNADHHPKRFIDIINEYEIETIEDAIKCEELWNINNGRTLCVKCHRKTNTWGKQAM